MGCCCLTCCSRSAVVCCIRDGGSVLDSTTVRTHWNKTAGANFFVHEPCLLQIISSTALQRRSVDECRRLRRMCCCCFHRVSRFLVQSPNRLRSPTNKTALFAQRGKPAQDLRNFKAIACSSCTKVRVRSLMSRNHESFVVQKWWYSESFAVEARSASFSLSKRATRMDLMSLRHVFSKSCVFICLPRYLKSRSPRYCIGSPAIVNFWVKRSVMTFWVSGCVGQAHGCSKTLIRASYQWSRPTEVVLREVQEALTGRGLQEHSSKSSASRRHGWFERFERKCMTIPFHPQTRAACQVEAEDRYWIELVRDSTHPWETPKANWKAEDMSLPRDIFAVIIS